MSTRQLAVFVLGIGGAIGAVASGVVLGLAISGPGERDLPVSIYLVNMLPLFIAGFLLLAATVNAAPQVYDMLRIPLGIVAVMLAAAALYTAIDLASSGEDTFDVFFALILVLSYLAPIAAIALAVLLSQRDDVDTRLLDGTVVFGIAVIGLTAAYIVWFHSNRSYDTSGNWWFFLSQLAWGGGWGLALAATAGALRGARWLPICRVGGVVIVVFALAYASEAEGGFGSRSVLDYLGPDSSRMLALGLIVLVLSNLRFASLPTFTAVILIACAVKGGLDAADFVVPGYDSELKAFLRRAAMPIATALLLLILNERAQMTRARGGP